MDTNVREFLDDVEKRLNAPGIDRARESVALYERKALDKYEMFVTDEALQFITRSSSPPVKQWIVSIVGRRQLQSNNLNTLGNTILLFSNLLKKAMQDLPSSFCLAQEILIYSSRLLSNSLKSSLLHKPLPLNGIWEVQTQLNQQILRITESASVPLRSHALKYLERLILCFSYLEQTQTQTSSGNSFTLQEIDTLAPPFSKEDLLTLGRQLLDQLINTLKKFAGFTKTDPQHANIPNQIVIINSLVIIQANRPKQFSKIIIEGLCSIPQVASLSWTQSSQSRTLSYTLRHALISIMLTNKWDQHVGNNLVQALTRLDAKDKAEAIYNKLRPVEFRALKRHTHPTNELPPAKRQRVESYVAPQPINSSNTQLKVANFIVQTFEKLGPPSTFRPPLHKPLDLTTCQNIVRDLLIVTRSLSQMKPVITSVAETDIKRDPRARNNNNVNQLQTSLETTPKTNKSLLSENINDVKATVVPDILEAAKKIGLPVEKPIIDTVPMNKDEILQMRNKAVERILEQEIGAKKAGKDPLRGRLVTRLVCLQKDLNHPLVISVIKFLMDEFPARIDLAIQWLYQEYYQCLLESLEPSIERNNDSWEKSRKIVIKEESRYYQLLRKIIERLCIALQPSKESDPLFRSFILRIPDLSEHVIQTLKQFCNSEETDRVSLGLTCFREIILYRPASRNLVLDLLLQYTVFSENDITRNKAIKIVLDSLCDNNNILQVIINFTKDILNTLELIEQVEDDKEIVPTTALPIGIDIVQDIGDDENMTDINNNETETETPENMEITDQEKEINEHDNEDNEIDDDDNDDNGDNEIGDDDNDNINNSKDEMDISSEINTSNITVIGNETKAPEISLTLPLKILTKKQVKQKIQLFIKLCSIKQSLLSDLLSVYSKSIKDVQQIIERESTCFFNDLQQDTDLLTEFLNSCPSGGESLLFHMLATLTENNNLSSDLDSLLKKLYKEEKLDARFLIYTLHNCDKEQIFEYLPALVSISSPELVSKAIRSILDTPQNENTISPTELLVYLHTLDNSKYTVKFKKQFDAIQECLKQPVFDQKSLAVVLQQLVDISPIPRILLRTMIDSFKKQPQLKSFILDLLSKLIVKQVWNQPKSWIGFIKCCEITKPESFSVLLQLPNNIFGGALKQLDEKIKTEFLKYCEMNPGIPKPLLSILETHKN